MYKTIGTGDIYAKIEITGDIPEITEQDDKGEYQGLEKCFMTKDGVKALGAGFHVLKLFESVTDMGTTKYKLANTSSKMFDISRVNISGIDGKPKEN